jgi:hypothetical protein
MSLRDAPLSCNWLTDKVSEEIGDGQVGEVDVGRRVHVLVLQDDENGGDVAQHAHHEDAGVDDGNGDDGGEG